MNERAVLLAIREALKDEHWRKQINELLLSGLAAASPLDPLYTLAVSERLIPCTHSTMKYWLGQLTLPARYRYDKQHRRHRMLYASELIAIRRKVIRGNLAHAIITGKKDKARKARNTFDASIIEEGAK